MHHEAGIRAHVYQDDETSRHAITEYLNRHGHTAEGFSVGRSCVLKTGGKCRRTNGKSCCDAMILDLGMPFAAALRFIDAHMWNGCKVMHFALIADSCTPEEESKARRLGCKVLRKPVSLPVLREWMNDILSARGSRRISHTPSVSMP